MTEILEKPASNAYLRDGALILYFDMAETPFVSRFDLDSLAQANFEVADKKDGLYSLILRDYTGQAQTIGQFSSKNDAHQALHSILKALLSQKETAVKSCSGIAGFFKGVLKFLLALMLLLLLLYAIMWLRLPSKHSEPMKTDQGPMAYEPAQGAKASKIPQGEAVDADEFLKQDAPAAPATGPAPEGPKE